MKRRRSEQKEGKRKGEVSERRETVQLEFKAGQDLCGVGKKKNGKGRAHKRVHPIFEKFRPFSGDGRNDQADAREYFVRFTDHNLHISSPNRYLVTA